MAKITPFLWFDNNLEEAMTFYASVFKDAKIGTIRRYGEGAPLPKGTAMTAEFELAGQKFMGLNGGPHFKFNEAVSFFVGCEDQAEVDYYWDKLVTGGEESQCGWLKDRFGLSWQIVPKILNEVLGDKDPVKAGRAMQAMLKMKKLDVQALKDAHAGK